MNNGTDFNNDGAMALLLVGETGTGKSSLAMRFPSPGFVLGDKNILHGAAWAKGKGHTWYYGDPLLDAAGKVLPDPQRWARSMAILREMGESEQVKTIVDDSLSHLTDYLKSALITAGAGGAPLIVGGESVMTKALWEPFATNLKRRITVARQFKKTYILIAHIATGENEMSGVKEFQYALQGQMKAELGRWFSDIWQCDAEPKSDAKYKETRGVRYFVRTAPTHRIKLKASSPGMPAEADVEELVKFLGLT